MEATTVDPSRMSYAANGNVGTATAAQPGVPPAYFGTSRSASLYVGDLNPGTTETHLFEVFSQIGKIQSVRVLRDAITRLSLGYAYVNFYEPTDAERALEIMQFAPINERPCRVMWSQRDPSLRRSGVGNIIIKNLHPSIDNKALADTFSMFGNILSCKVSMDEEGKSRGFGFVHFDSEASANQCIAEVNGRVIQDKVVVVENFVVRGRRNAAQWTNCYVKNIPYIWTDADLQKEFETFGEITSAKVKVHEEGDVKDLEGKSKGFGFVNFATHEAATKAVETMNGKKFMDGEVEKEIVVVPFQSKKERSKDLRDKYSLRKKERMAKYQGCNVYVKNLDEEATDEWLRETFSKFGTVTSAKIMTDPQGVSRGFGFVCFSSPEEASTALSKMQGKMCFNKPITVALYQPAQARREMLQMMNQTSTGRQPGVPPMMQGGPFYPQAPYMMQQPPAMGMPFNLRGTPSPGGMMPRTMAPMQQGLGAGGRSRFYPMPDYRRGDQLDQFPMRNTQSKQQFQPRQNRRQQPPPMSRSVPRPVVQAPPQPEVVQTPPSQYAGKSTGGIDHTRLASATPEEQKSILGENLYPLIQQRNGELAGKITGMILELDNTEILHLLESPELLDEKVNEAMQVLNEYKGKSEFE